ncbi:cytoplasmic dynein 2 intermediate chain 2 isoform 1-T1 [Synchiropus picturatus]
MFSDESLASLSIQPSWRTARESSQESKGCQTQAVHSCQVSVQVRSTSAASTQTQQPDPSVERQDDAPPSPGLSEFLRRVEGLVTLELLKNSRSHAFDDHRVQWEDGSQPVTCLHRLQAPSEEELEVTCVSWSCTGAVIACAYGRTSHRDWNSDKSYVCTWNLDRRNVSLKQADQVIDVPTGVTALCCHPERPAVIAGGLYSGEVVVWDTSRAQDLVLAQTGMSTDSHREPVYQVKWVPLQKKEFGVLSACSGGRVLLWTLDSEQNQLVLHAAYALMMQQVPQISSSFKAGGSSAVGITSLALSHWDPDTFLVGSEAGVLLRCSFSSQTLAAAPSEGESVTLRAPAVFSFRPSTGPIHSIHCSPFHRNVFVSAGTDGLAHLHSLLQTEPLLSLRVSDSYVFEVQWSPTRPLVFAAATGQGDVQIFDLSRRSLKPAATIDHGQTGQAAACLSFNSQNPRLLAVGKTDGTVGIWQLSTHLTEQIPSEMDQLEHMATQAAE